MAIDIFDYIQKAVLKFLQNRTEAYIIYEHIVTVNDNLKVIYFKDSKLQNEFIVEIKPDEILDPQTATIDLLAMVPSNANLEIRTILRIAYKIYLGWSWNVYDTYKKEEKDQNKYTWVNAKNWYDNLF